MRQSPLKKDKIFFNFSRFEVKFLGNVYKKKEFKVMKN
jgi:hypothetical protein